MISIPRFLDRSNDPSVTVVGLGNAGVNLADRITMHDLPGVRVIAMNSDMQSLSSSVSPAKVALGAVTTRGLGAGGDPEVGFDAARESLPEIEEALAGADVVFVCAGLGGGTSSGAAAPVLEVARKAGALAIAVVTSPFAFEGKRRSQQAQAAMAEILRFADAILHFENDRMAELTAPRSGVAETFAACDDLLTAAMQSLVRLMASGGPVPVGFPDVLAVLRSGDGACLFGSGSAVGSNRAHAALEQALRSPLLERERLAGEAGRLLVHVQGPPDLTFAEVSAILEEASRRTAEQAALHTGVSIVEDPGAPVTVTFVGKCGALRAIEPPRRVAAAAVPERTVAPPPVAPREAPQPAPQPSPEPELMPQPDPVVEPTPKPPSPRPVKMAEPEKPKTTAPKIKQETLQFEPVARGRFEKIEPTIVEGEDLDVPTFLRRKIGKK